MTANIAIPTLELDSQKQLLVRLKLLINFDSNFIQVTGNRGSGKTQLAFQLVEQDDLEQNFTFVQCVSQHKTTLFRTSVIQQLFKEKPFDPQDSLVDSFSHILAAQPCKVTIIVDDANFLDFTLFSELWSLVQEAKTRKGWDINVVLFSQSGLLDSYISQVLQIGGETPVEIEIPYLSSNEAAAFVHSMRFVGLLSANGMIQLEHVINSRDYYPGDLLALSDTEINAINEAKQEEVRLAKKSRKSQKKKKLKKRKGFLGYGLLISILVFFSIAISTAWWWMPTTIQQDVSTWLRQKVSEYKEDGKIKLVNTAIDKDSAAENKDIVFRDDYDLPEQSVASAITVGGKVTSHQQRVLVPAIVVDNLLDYHGETMEDIDLDQIEFKPEVIDNEQLDGAINFVEKSEDLEKLNADKAREHVVKTPKELVQQALKKEKAKHLDKRELAAYMRLEPLLKVATSHYALQFMAAENKTKALKFIRESNMVPGQINMYLAKHGDKLWYIFISGDYHNKTQARQAVKELPKKYKNLKPWIKSYKTIKQEIRQAQK